MRLGIEINCGPVGVVTTTPLDNINDVGGLVLVPASNDVFVGTVMPLVAV